MITEPLLHMRGIGKSFPGVRALDDVNFDLRPGEVHALLGENGAGKSTLLKILSGAYRADEGEIWLAGRRVQIHSPHHAQCLGISTIYQELNLIPHLSVSANIYLGREPLIGAGILNKKAARNQAAQLLELLSVSVDPQSLVASLSLAHQQMVEVAKALAFDAKILIMDEPTSALTTSETQILFEVIRKLRQRGVGIIYISHRMEEIFAIANRVTVLRDGKNVETRDTSSVTIGEIIRLMADRQLQEHFPRRPSPPGRLLLEVRHLATRRKLEDINFTLRAGEILGIAGLLGSGRSTLARTLFGANRIAAGSIRVRDQEARLNSPRAAIRHGIGFLTEDRKQLGLVLNLSVKKNISLPNASTVFSHGVLRRNRERDLALNLTSQLRIRTPHIDQHVVFLSGGNQQKVVLAKWLARQVDILIFDEPTRGIDVAAKVDIYELMNHLTEQGVGMIMISSDLPEILGMSDRILVMHQGHIAAEFSRAEASQEKVLNAALGNHS